MHHFSFNYVQNICIFSFVYIILTMKNNYTNSFQAWQAKNNPSEEDEDININKPLFEINTFNSKQVSFI